MNERWLDGYRPWVYGAGFGWQIGAGLATYIMTAAVYLLVVLGAVSGRPWAALALGALFGLVRGLAVLLGRGVTSPSALHAVHRRMARWAPVSATLTSAVEAAVALVAAAWLVLAAAGGGGAWAGTRPGAVVLATVGLGVIVAGAAVAPAGRGAGGRGPATSPVPVPAPRAEARRG